MQNKRQYMVSQLLSEESQLELQLQKQLEDDVARCQYFAGILSGGWVESLGNVIVLPPFSYNVVYFALCHIYSGLATIPDSVSIVELATIADMLSLEGLKEAIMFTLKSKYCHNFHKPCDVCIVGVLECLPVTTVYGLDDLHHKCLKCITRHFTKIWPTKAFATLPTDLMEKCYQHLVVNITVENIARTIYGCGIILASLECSRWSENVARLCRRVMNEAANFSCDKLALIYQAILPLPGDDLPHPAKLALDDFLATVVEWAPPEQLISAYRYLSGVDKNIRSGRFFKPDTPLHPNVSNWRMQIEGTLVRMAPRVVVTQGFKELPPHLLKRLRELGCIRYGAHALPLEVGNQVTRKPNNRTLVKSKPPISMRRSMNIAQVRASFVPYAPKPILPGTSVGLREVKKPHGPEYEMPKVRTTRAQEERAKFNRTKELVIPQQKAPQTRSLAKTVPPRYLQPSRKETRGKSLVSKELPRIASSDSSRTSPAPVRTVGASPGRAAGAASASQSSLATASRPRTAEPSTDSLSASQPTNNYATYTKSRTTKASAASINTEMNEEPKKTKIPVSLNQGPKCKRLDSQNSRDKQKSAKQAPKSSTATVKPNERKLPGSLMNATKSSSAKIVPKVKTDLGTSCKKSQRSLPSRPQAQHLTSQKVDRSPIAHASWQQPQYREHLVETKTAKSVPSKIQLNGNSNKPRLQKDENETCAEIPVMERSGTFSKDEPSFNDIIINLVTPE